MAVYIEVIVHKSEEVQHNVLQNRFMRREAVKEMFVDSNLQESSD